MKKKLTLILGILLIISISVTVAIKMKVKNSEEKEQDVVQNLKKDFPNLVRKHFLKEYDVDLYTSYSHFENLSEDNKKAINTLFEYIYPLDNISSISYSFDLNEANGDHKITKIALNKENKLFYVEDLDVVNERVYTTLFYQDKLYRVNNENKKYFKINKPDNISSDNWFIDMATEYLDIAASIYRGTLNLVQSAIVEADSSQSSLHVTDNKNIKILNGSFSEKQSSDLQGKFSLELNPDPPIINKFSVINQDNVEVRSINLKDYQESIDQTQYLTILEKIKEYELVTDINHVYE